MNKVTRVNDYGVEFTRISFEISSYWLGLVDDFAAINKVSRSEALRFMLDEGYCALRDEILEYRIEHRL